ncbi:MAG: twin-arginine translocase subunit TatC [Negativicutes bacterium]|nr:twin-arginine translocase subunit TatC [Negativicutes bacterium]
MPEERQAAVEVYKPDAAEHSHGPGEFKPESFTEAGGEMSLVDHLQELRARIIKAAIAVGIGFIISYFYAEQLIQFITAPAGKLYYMSPAEGFFSYLKIAFVTGILGALPVILYQIWAFLVPALTANERTALVILVPSSVILFFAGLLFSYFLVLPAALKFFIGFASDNLQPLLSLGQYLSFIISFLLPFGIIFELPLFLVVLAKVGLISSAFLAGKRKMVVVLSFVVGAVISPTPDVFSQTMIAIPLLLLYEASILVLKHFMGK